MSRLGVQTETVLVVDDDPRMRHLLDKILRTAGFRVLAAEDGNVVLALVRQHGVDIVLLDLNLPRVSGLNALRALRSAQESVASSSLRRTARKQ